MNHSGGQKHWRSLEQLADTAEFRQFLHREFPQGASEMDNSWSRRNFLALMGASLALAGLTGCRRPEEKIVPYVQAPEEVIPGIAQRYATSMPFGAGAYGLVVESHEGRPTKIEGNPLHPSSRGASNAFMQAAILDLYDPDRSRHVLHKGHQKSWDDFVTFWREQRSSHVDDRGASLAVLCEPFSSPTMARLKREFLNTFPNSLWAAYAPVTDESIFDGTKLATGELLSPVYHFDQADIIVSLDADFLLTESDNVANARAFANGRRIDLQRVDMNRLYVAESGYTVTGAMADHQLRVQSSRIIAVAIALASELAAQGLQLDYMRGIPQPDLSADQLSWVKAIARDLMQARSRAVIVAGRRQPAVLHALVMAMNAALGNIGRAVSYVSPKDLAPSNTADLARLSAAIKSGRISTLIVLGGHPVYSSPVDLNLPESLKQVETVVHCGTHVDETAQQASWHLPETHFLESWGDARAADGTASVVQPLIEPLYGGRTAAEMLQFIVTGNEVRGYEIVRDTWKALLAGADFEKRWRAVLHDGLLENSAAPSATITIRHQEIHDLLSQQPSEFKDAGISNLEVNFAVSPSMFDGRFANNGWLQELPDPVTKLTWDNATLMSPKTANELGVGNGDVVSLTYRGRALEIPVWIVPGQADYSVSLELGYGRSFAGQVGNGVGFNAYALRTSDAPYFDSGLAISRTGRTYELATTQEHGSMEGRPLIREGTLDEYRKNPRFAQEMVEHPPLVSLWKDRAYNEGYQWGMAIDLNACIGCGACTIACQSENNIPIVGKTQVRKGREMHWIRVDRYFEGDVDNPRMAHQPVPCQHCENAPCEQVCPVAATVHDKEGLNTMVYNRCIGTRYCSNNCPYKVRRFNFFNYTKDYHETIAMAQNPDVTVRSRGVMEKCTYCVQRINEARRTAKREDRQITDGELLTACQQACPAQAITFGNIIAPDSQVAKAKADSRNYHLLGELNVRPRTSYLARLRNPNSELSEA
ncbi:MAG TPA: TAT-variant-translocated molybdopterin oxidoreductase [Candidatus Deferrimicrobium sp.]|nr:TAT-variant-translocated molybdopterin oxidoreductase [Candidatus Deferrimicrobium sp.]